MSSVACSLLLKDLIEGVPPPADGRLPLLPPVRHHGGGGVGGHAEGPGGAGEAESGGGGQVSSQLPQARALLQA